MGWGATEFAQVVDNLRRGDHKAVAMAVSNLFDRQSKTNGTKVDAEFSDTAQEVATKLVRSPFPTEAARALNTPFIISSADPVLAVYTVRLDVTAGLLNSQDITVILYVDGFEKTRAYLYTNQLLGLINVGLNNVIDQVLLAYIPAGSTVNLVTSGTGAATIVSSVELVFHG